MSSFYWCKILWGFILVDFSLGWARPDRSKKIFFKSLNFATSPYSMENLNPPKNTLFYPFSIAIFTEISSLQQIRIFFKIKWHTANPDTPLKHYMELRRSKRETNEDKS